MLTPVHVWQYLSQMRITKSLSEIDTALEQVNRQAIFNKHRSRIRVEVWDKKSPINGVPAERIFASRTDISEGEVYLLYIDDQLVYFQPHDPDQAGLVPMTKDNILDVANRHADRIAEQFTDEEVLEKLLSYLAKG